MNNKDKIIKMFCEDEISGGLADNKNIKDVLLHHFPDLSTGSKAYVSSFYLLNGEFKKGIEVEMEHTDDESVAKEIAIDHLWEDPDYYSKLEKVEGK